MEIIACDAFKRMFYFLVYRCAMISSLFNANFENRSSEGREAITTV